MSANGYCPKCHRIKRLTNHHITPVRFFGKNDCILKVCRECHDDIEQIIPRFHKLRKYQYMQLTKNWLTETYMEHRKEADVPPLFYSMPTMDNTHT
jgi:hypothetical protein